MLINGLFRGGRERRGWTLLLVVAGAGAMLGSYRLVTIFVTSLSPSAAARDSLVGGAVNLLTGFTAVSSITFALSSLYFARDLVPLLAAPLPPRTIILTRMYTQLGFGVGIATVLAGPALTAYLVSAGRVLALPIVILALASVVTIALALATAFVIVAVRLVPARYVRDAGGLVVTVAVFLVAAINVAVRGGGALQSTPIGVGGLGRGAGPSRLLPTGWAQQSIVAALGGGFPAALGWLTLLLIPAVVLPPALAWAVEGAYIEGFRASAAASRGAPRHRRRDSPSPGRRHDVILRVRRRRTLPIWVTLAIKDLREVQRDASQLGQLLLPLVLFAVYIAAPGQAESQLGRTSLPRWFGTALTAGFASLFAATGIALRGVGSEGERIWLLRVAPVDVRNLLAAKYAVGWGIAAILGAGLLWVGQWRAHVSITEAIPPTLRLLVIIGGLVGMATGIGAIRPRLDWTDPRRAVSIGVTVGFLFVGSVYLCVAFVILGLPYGSRNPGAGARGLADLGILVLALVASGTALTVGSRRLRRLEV